VIRRNHKTDHHPAAVAAANWWAAAIGAPTFRITDRNSGPEDQEIGMVAALTGHMFADKHPITGDQAAVFAEELAKTITEELGRVRYHVTLGVDYGPDQELSEAAEKAGINGSRFPWKTNMWVKADVVTVSAGYRGAEQIVWASDEWMANSPACARQRWDRAKCSVDSYTGDPFVCSLPKYHEGDCQHDTAVSLCRTCGHQQDSVLHSQAGYGTTRHEFNPLPAGQSWEPATA